MVYKPQIYMKANTKKELTQAKLMLSIKEGREVTYDQTIKTIIDLSKKELLRRQK